MAGLSDLLGTLFPSSTLTPEMGSLMATDPEAAAQALAARGVPPPQGDWRPDWVRKGVEAIKEYGRGGEAAPVGALGESPLAYNPLAAPALSTFPQPQAVAPQAPAPASMSAKQAPPAPTGADPLSGVEPGAASPMGGLSGLAKALSGVKAPAEPAFQKISSPSAPRPAAMPQGSPMAALLAKAVAGDPQAMLTLRAAIGGGR